MLGFLLGGVVLAAAAGGPVIGPVLTLDKRTLSPARIEATVTDLMGKARVTGLGLAIINKGEIVYLNAFGRANVEKDAPLTVQSTMYAASFTKAMFASMVMQLAAAGTLDLDAPIERYLRKPLPEYEKYADLKGDPRWKMFTARMLLSHTSGLPNFRFFTKAGTYEPEHPLWIEFKPGSRYAYSGEGINLLQFVLEAGLGLDVGALMRERIFEPLGMTRTSMVWRDDFATDLAQGYDEAGKLIGHNARRSVRAAGSADSTIQDMARFLRATLRGETISGKFRDEMLKSQVRIRSVGEFPTLDETTTSRDDRVSLSSGLGWGVLKTPHGRAFFKGGHDDGWENYMIGFDKPGAGIVLMTNSSNGDSIFKELLQTLIGDSYTPWEWQGFTPWDATRPTPGLDRP
ncbi:MAG: beta-lactamase family protein [Vicinamibacteria bacterium]|nr:beta-lactamase family protein [Vicinamibacteria bacterium]